MPENTIKYCAIECTTSTGQIVSVECDSSKSELLKKSFKKNIKFVTEKLTVATSLSHGSCAKYSRFKIKQHNYGANMVAYRELLEILDAPKGKIRFVIFHHRPDYHGSSSCFTEWKTLKNAKKAFDRIYRVNFCNSLFETDEEKESNVENQSGFIRTVRCGELQPWFYAIGREQIIGDCVVPEYLNDDPVYRLGQKFIVYSRDGTSSIKTCLGCRFVSYKHEEDILGRRSEEKKCDFFRLVYFNDGFIWDESQKKNCWNSDEVNPPEIILDKELWIVEAMKQFREILSGNQTNFSINFDDGNTFIGKLSKSRLKNHCEAADYNLRVTIDGESELREGWVNNFIPTPKYPDIVSRIKNGLNDIAPEKVLRVEVVSKRISTDQKIKPKKWSGVFFRRSKDVTEPV